MFSSTLTLEKRFASFALSYITGSGGSSSIKKVFQGDQKEEMFFDRLHHAHSIVGDYAIAISRYRDSILTANLDEAESVLRSYYAILETMIPTISTHAASIHVGCELGDFNIISKHLGILADAELPGEWTMDKYGASS